MTAPALSAPKTYRPRPEALACILSGGAGAMALLVLVGLRMLAPGPGVAALLAVAACTALLARGLRGKASALQAAPPAADPQSERRAALSGALEDLPDPLLVLTAPAEGDSPGGRVLFANAAARDLLRLSGEGAPLATMLRNPEVLEIVDEALIGRIDAEAAYQPGGAVERYWRAQARPLPGLVGGPGLALLLLTDETDVRRSERMRADFLANASHELRTPLASLTGFIETLRGHAKDDPAARDRFLEIMAAQADRMARLVADLMSLSRIEMNEHVPPAGEVDLAMTMIDVIDAMAPQAAGASVTLRPIDPRAAGPAVVIGDRDQILQVIQNLIDNGLKYAGRGGSVTVALDVGVSAAQAVAPRNPAASRLSLLTPDRSGSRYAVVSVSDSGPGIAREHLPRLTERFYRIEGQKSGEHSGTGLGLAIVKHIVNRHRGGLAVETVLGEGTTFLLFLPLVEDPPAAT